MGPNAASVFIRDCKNCKFVITAQSVRFYNCKHAKVMLYTQTEPVIESSRDITIVPHQYAYEEMFAQMKAAKISVWNNRYAEPYDFT